MTTRSIILTAVIIAALIATTCAQVTVTEPWDVSEGETNDNIINIFEANNEEGAIDDQQFTTDNVAMDGQEPVDDMTVDDNGEFAEPYLGDETDFISPSDVEDGFTSSDMGQTQPDPVNDATAVSNVDSEPVTDSASTTTTSAYDRPQTPATPQTPTNADANSPAPLPLPSSSPVPSPSSPGVPAPPTTQSAPSSSSPGVPAPPTTESAPSSSSGGRQLYGIAYNPATSDQWCPSLDKVVKDLTLLAPMTHRIRTYGVGCHIDPILTAIATTPALSAFKIIVGIDLQRDKGANSAAIKEVMDVVVKHGAKNIDLINVGNEVLLRKDMSVQDWISAIGEARSLIAQSNLPIQVSTCDVFDSFKANPSLIGAVDTVLINIHPYFSQGVEASGAAANTLTQYKQMLALSQGKPLRIGETGWPSDGGGARTSPAAVTEYMKSIACQAADDVPYYFFEAFDARWKKNVPEVEYHWGVFNADGSRKPGVDFAPITC